MEFLRGGFVSRRCAKCGTISLDDSQEPIRQKASRFGKLAATFGALSILFSILTCVPAIYFAVKCLRIKQSPYVVPRGRIAAIIGIWTSIIFTPVSSCCIVSMIFTSYVAAISNRTEDPGEIANMAKQIGSFKLDKSWEPRKAQTILGSQSVQYVLKSGSGISEDREVLAVVEFTRYTTFPPVSEAQIVNQSRLRSLGTTGHLTVQDNQVLIWNFIGAKREVFLDFCKNRDDEDAHRFIVIATISNRKYSIVAVSKLDENGNQFASQADLQKIFDSFVPAEPR